MDSCWLVAEEGRVNLLVGGGLLLEIEAILLPLVLLRHVRLRHCPVESHGPGTNCIVFRHQRVVIIYRTFFRNTVF